MERCSGTTIERDLGCALLIALALNSGTSFAYVWLLEASFGATLGKAMVGIRVTRTNGRNAFAASAIRNLFRLVDELGFYLVGGLVAGCSRFRQRLGDICAGTAVVEAEFGFGLKTVAVLLWTTVLVGAGWALPRICAGERSGSSLTANLDTWDNPPSRSTWTCPLDTSTFLHVIVCLRGIGDHRK